MSSEPTLLERLIALIDRIRKTDGLSITLDTKVEDIDYDRVSTTPGKYWLFAEAGKEFVIEIDSFAAYKIATVGDLVRVVENGGHWQVAS